MANPKTTRMEDILKTAEALRATGNITPALLERTGFRPPRCEVFKSPCTGLKTDDSFRFRTDREAEGVLPDIIRNPVQRIVGMDAADPAVQKAHTRKRNIGIVFSGGPAPGGK